MEKLKMIRGSENRAKDVRETLKSWGAVDVGQFSCKDKNLYYFVINGRSDMIKVTNPLLNFLNYEVVELPEPEPKFQPFQKVLVRDKVGECWQCSLFSHKVAGEEYSFWCLDTLWRFCIPYEGNEHLVGTTNSPKGGAE